MTRYTAGLTSVPLPDDAATTAVLGITALVVLWLVVRTARTALSATGRGLRRAGRAARHLARADSAADQLTYLAAVVATAVVAQGMWLVFRDELHIEPVLRVFTFGFIELAALTSAVRARRSVKAGGPAGVDGAAVWALTGLSGLLSSLHAASFPEAALRLSAPLVAAWLWERGMGVERRRVTGRSTIHWRVTPERVLIRLGLAEGAGRSGEQADTERHLHRLAVAARRARGAKADTWRGWWLSARVDSALRVAVERTHLAVDVGQQRQLMAALAALGGADALARAEPQAPWEVPAPRLGPEGVPEERVPAAPEVTTEERSPNPAEPDPYEPQERTPVPGPRAPTVPGSQVHEPEVEPAQAAAPLEVAQESAPQPTTHGTPGNAADPLDALAQTIAGQTPLPSIKAIKQLFNIGTSNASLVKSKAQSLKSQTSPEHHSKIIATHHPELLSLDHLEHTPMQQS